jgi:hypothetical protein
MASIASRRRGDGANFICVKKSMDGLFKETVSCIGGFLNVFQSQRRVFVGAFRFLEGSLELLSFQ